MPRVVEAWSAWMSAMAWQAAALVCIAVLIDALLRRTSWPHLRHALWLLVAVKLVLPPTLSSPVAVAPIAEAAPAAMAQSATAAIPGVLLAVWALGVLAFGTIALRRTIRGRRSTASAAPASPRQRSALHRAARALGRNRRRRLPRLVVSTDASGPAVTGILRPTILLPEDAPEGRELEHVLMHELAHVHRGDLWVQAAYGLVHLLYWFHPCVWLARRRAHAARELCCDATVAHALGDDAPSYRRTLLHYAARRAGLAVPGTAGFLPRASTLFARLSALERGSWRRPGLRRAATAVLTTVLAAAVLPMAPPATGAELLSAGPSELEAAGAAVDRVLAHPNAYGSIEKQMAVLRYLALKNQR